MELTGNSPVDDVDISETDREKPLTLRYHHLRTLMMMGERHSLFRDRSAPHIPFDQLYLHPEKVEQILQGNKERRLKNLDRYLKGRVNKSDGYETGKEAREMALDYTGPKGAYKQQHLDARAEAYGQILLGDPDRKIEMTWGPDIVCNACQSNGANQPGNHCLLITGPDEETDEKDFYRYVEFARTKPEFEDKIGESTDARGWHTFEMSLGTLRNPAFLSIIYDKFFEEIKERGMAAKQSEIQTNA